MVEWNAQCLPLCVPLYHLFKLSESVYVRGQ